VLAVQGYIPHKPTQLAPILQNQVVTEHSSYRSLGTLAKRGLDKIALQESRAKRKALAVKTAFESKV